MRLLTSTLGRILFAAPFLGFGITHLVMGAAMAAIVPSWVPGDGPFWVYLTGVLLVVGSVAILTNRYARAGSLLLAGFLVVVIVTVQIPGMINEASRQLAMTMFLKDTALLGGALLYAGIAEADKKRGK